MPQRPGSEFKKFAAGFGVKATVNPYEGRFRRVDLRFRDPNATIAPYSDNVAGSWRYELTYQREERDRVFDFMRWVITSRIQGRSLYHGPRIDLTVPHRPDIAPASFMCRYSWTADAWAKRTPAGPPKAPARLRR
ncbi:MAG: hypothetical protein H6721_24070 [Sandaracinus sp.]|nr:hypothetical protein [Sandaracinus sp.]MCB9635210.1 hypothetical protein [Sandaracinus sp.]